MSEALACNCIGVTLQMQGVHKVEEALKYHLQHLAAADVPGKFIAHSNIGLAYQVRGMTEGQPLTPTPTLATTPTLALTLALTSA